MNDKIRERLKIGRERYSHGIIVNDDTTQYGTSTNSWREMAEEELLDCAVYLSAAYIKCLGKTGEINNDIIELIESCEYSYDNPYKEMIYRTIQLWKDIVNKLPDT